MGSEGRGRGRGRGGRGGRGGGYNGGQNSGYNSSAGTPRRGSHANGAPDEAGGVNATAVAKTPNSSSTTHDEAAQARPTHQAAPALTSTPAPIPSTPAPRAPVVSAPPPPPKPILPYDYEILTEERIKSWKDTGSDEVLSAATEALVGENVIGLSTVFQEIVRASLDGKVNANDAGQLVRQILESAPPEGPIDAVTFFLDTLSILAEQDMLNPRLRAILTSTGIPSDVMRQQLDGDLLKAAQLVRDTFTRMFIRQQTSVLYRQSNYNLLREETEGYSKLLTELFTTTADEPPTAEVVGDTFENIKALIGSFDLDAGRVLDVVLDVFATLLVKHYRFFVKLLRASSWWPETQDLISAHLPQSQIAGLPGWASPDHSGWTLADDDRAEVAATRQERDTAFWTRAREVGQDAWFELGGQRLLSEDDIANALKTVASAANAEVDEQKRGARLNETRTWIKDTQTLPPPGSAVAAQLLGFKLQFYASTSRDAKDVLPVNLIYLSALLIKIGFISLRDLYAHLWPEDAAMESVKARATKEKEERELAKRPGGGTLNALARAGALADDTVPAPTARGRDAEPRGNIAAKSDPTSKTGTSGTPGPKTEEEPREELPEPTDQKVQLLRSLLCIGAIPEALYLLGRYTWLPDLFPDLPDHIHRILHYSLSKVYEPCQPLRERSSVREAIALPDEKQTGLFKNELRVQEAPQPRAVRWAQMEMNDQQDGTDYRFYWDDWSDNVPICQTVDDIFTLCDTFMNFTGVKIGLDPSLLMKLARVGKRSLAEDSSQTNRDRWIDLCKRLLCPALSMTRANPGIVNEVFDILKQFPTKLRFSVYNEWFLGPTSRLPDVAAAFALATAETKDILKRMSKTNMKPMARALAKIACASPGITFAVVLNQIESYDNLTDVVVECGRYFTYMGYDVLSWSVMTTLGRAGRSRVGDDGMTTSSWLTSLSLFTGKVFKRYATMSTLPILQYVANQVRKGNFTDLKVLRELIVSMAGIAPDTNFTDAQVQAMAGGEHLQAATLRQVQDKRHESKPSAKRLVKTLIDNGLVGPLLVSIAQQRQMCVFDDNQTSLKIIGENFDDIHINMTQYLELLRNNLTIEEFRAIVPDVADLIHTYGIDASIAFTIHRKSIARAVDDYDAAHPKQKLDTTSKAKASTDVEMVDASTPAIVQETLADVPDTIASPSVPDVSSPATITTASMTSTTDSSSTPWHPVLQDLMDKMRPNISGTLDAVSLPFFVTFWQLSLHDLMAPASSYTAEDARQKERIAAINADRSDVTQAGARKRDQEKKAIADFRDRLIQEMKDHMENYKGVRARLEMEKKSWFADSRDKDKSEQLIEALLQECFLPRLLMSPLDSYFAWKMFIMMHSSGTPQFRTLVFLDRLFGEKLMQNSIFQCTAREAECLGRFLSEVFQELSAWHASKATYEKRAWGTKKELPGFREASSHDNTPGALLDYEDYRRYLNKWHAQFTNALMACLNNGEYMHIKNAIVVLRCVCGYFPAINWQGTRLYNTVEEYSKSERYSRQDIWVASSSLLGNLKARQKEWVLPQAFSIVSIATLQHRA